jgi:phosphatidylserine decarboxylase
LSDNEPGFFLMRIDPAGWPFILGGAVVGLIGALLGGWPWAIPGVLLALLFLFFFRDPDRVATQARDAVLSPADGRVMVAGAPSGLKHPAGIWQQISIFLSPLDVHVNRMPISGRVTHVEYHPGSFLPAYRHDAGDLNEYYEIWLDHEGQTIVVRQIVGLLARRVVCRTKVGATVEAGERYGVMKFGSRMDLFLPVDATLKVAPGDSVRAAITVLAELAPSRSEP